jgi:GT2 family glycosyltransferase
MKWTVICAANNEQVLQSCLLNSPDIGDVAEVILQKGYASAAVAYNSGLQEAKTDLVVLIHQDVYLPKGWLAVLNRSLDVLSKVDPNWGVLGVWGVNESKDSTGFLYCAANGRLGQLFKGTREVRSLDEVLLVMRKSSGLRFDERLPGFHMYGTDICLEARRRGMKSYVVPAPCVHNTNGYRMLPLQFWLGYLFMRKKWKTELPIATSCTEITFACWPMIRWNFVRLVNVVLGRHRVRTRFDDPSQLALNLIPSDEVSAP